MHSILISEYMDHDPHAIQQDCNVRDAVAALLEAHVIGAPVINEKDEVVGFISEQDCIKEMLNDAFYCEEPPPVKEVMATEVCTYSANTSIVEMAQAMMKSKHKNYPVVDNKKLVGLISRSNILKALIEYDSDCYIKAAN